MELNINEKTFLHQILIEKQLQTDENGLYVVIEDPSKWSILTSLINKLDLTDVNRQWELLKKIESVKNFEWGLNPIENENRMCELIKLL